MKVRTSSGQEKSAFGQEFDGAHRETAAERRQFRTGK